jgi:type IX secretion system PorP/SprF family membrane protein
MKNPVFSWLLWMALLLQAQTGYGQDPHFSQFFSSPLTLNPALTGKFDGQYRLSGIYRNQWPAFNNAFITSSFSLDGAILSERLNENNRLALGIYAMTDKSANGILKSNFVAVSCAYHLGLDEDGYQQLGVGFQGAYASKRLDVAAIKFESQLDLAGQWTRPSNENFNNSQVNVNYFDMNAGLLYNGSTNGSNNYYVGASVYHINSPSEGFMKDGNYQLARRYTLHAGGYFPTGEITTLYLTALYNQQSTTREVVLGSALGFLLSAQNDAPVNFYTGCWTRLNNQYDALIPYIGLDFNSMRMGLTYDINISHLEPGSKSKGGMELTLVYVHQKSTGRKTIPCPRF